MSMPNFEVRVVSGFSNSDVRNLSETETSLAKAMGLSADEFRRSKMEFIAREERARARGRELGEIVQAMLAEAGTEYRLVSVNWNPDTLSWRIEVAAQNGFHNVVVSWELADDVLDSRTRGELQRLRNIVFFGIGRRDLVGRVHG